MKWGGKSRNFMSKIEYYWVCFFVLAAAFRCEKWVLIPRMIFLEALQHHMTVDPCCMCSTPSILPGKGWRGRGRWRRERVFPEPSDDSPVTVGGKELCCLCYLLISSSCGQLLCFTSASSFGCDFLIYRCKSVHRRCFLLHLSSPWR